MSAKGGSSSTRILKDGWLENYLKYTSAQESPDAFHLWIGLSVLAGALQRRVYFKQGYFRVFPNLYIVLTAPTGVCSKSTAADIGVDLLQDVDGSRLIRNKITPEGLLAYLGSSNLTAAPEEREEKTLTKEEKEDAEDDKSDEEEEEKEKKRKTSVHGIQGKRSVTYKQSALAFINAPELATFIGSSSYSTGLSELLTDLYDSRDHFEYRTRTRGEILLENLYVNLLGCSTPEWLAKGFAESDFGGGFIGRILFIVQTVPRGGQPFIELTPEQEALKPLLIMDLQHISRLAGACTFTPEATELYSKWYMAYKPDYSSKLAGYYVRKRAHIIKLSILLSINKSDDLIIRESHVKKAMLILAQAEQLMPEAFTYIGATAEARVAEYVRQELKNNDGVLPFQTLLQKMRGFVRNVREFTDIIDVLEQSGIIVRIPTKDRGVFYALKDAHDEMVKKLAMRQKEKEEEKMKQKEKMEIVK